MTSPPGREFHHREHLQTAWYHITRDGDRGVDETLRNIRAFAEHSGHAQKFHTTLTLVWAQLVRAAIREEIGCTSFEELLRRHAALLDKALPLRYYSREVLFSERAREEWVPPDRNVLP
jgi:hypothetical protein